MSNRWVVGIAVRTVRRLFISVHIELVRYDHALVWSLLKVGMVLDVLFFARHNGVSRTMPVLV